MSLCFDGPNKFDYYVLAVCFALRVVHLVPDEELFVWQIKVPFEKNLTYVYPPTKAGKDTEDLRLGLLHEVHSGVEGFLSEEDPSFEFAERGRLVGGLFQFNHQLVFRVQEKKARAQLPLHVETRWPLGVVWDFEFEKEGIVRGS